jgi:hypothetical protein
VLESELDDDDDDDDGGGGGDDDMAMKGLDHSVSFCNPHSNKSTSCQETVLTL